MASSEPTCTNCQTPYQPSDLYCLNCGWILPHALQSDSTYHLGPTQTVNADLQWGTSYFHTRARLFLVSESSGNTMQLIMSGTPIVLGRKTKEPNLPNLVDLAVFGAAELGVSRNHVKLEQSNNLLHVIDLESSNGTYLNRLRMTSGIPYVLRNRSVLQLGSLVLRVQFS